MKLLFAVSLALSCCNSLVAASPYSEHTVHEYRDTISLRWTRHNRVPSYRRLPVRIGLTQSNLDKAEDYLLDISHPKSPNYGKIWTPEDVIAAFQPSDTAVQAVRDWLASHGIVDVTHSENKGWLAFDAPASQVEALLKTEYYEHADQITGGVVPACDIYYVPAKIQEHIDYITPGTKLMAPVKSDIDLKVKREGRKVSRGDRLKKTAKQEFSQELLNALSANASDLSTCDQAITPACVAALYNIPPSNVTAPNNSLGVFEAELQYWDQPDLDQFFANFTPWIPNGTHPLNEEIDGGVAQTDNISLAGGESMLDLLLAYPIVYPQTITVLNVDDIHYQTWENDTYTWGFNSLLDAIDGSYCTYSAYNETGDLPNWDPTYPDPGPDGYNGTLQCGVFDPPNVISLSYGGQEADVPISYQKRQCNEYLKLGLQGVTFVFASGDSGVSNYPEPYGFDGPTGCLGPELNIFNPTWPNNCPWLTNVGATKVYAGFSVFDPESAALDIGKKLNYSSGGGFSNVYPVPDYQKAAVDVFFRDHEPGYPFYEELVANADNYTLPNITALAGDTGGIYNRNGRGIPDVAANGDNIAVFVGGEFGLSGGTSASTPIFAGIINRINDERLAVGKSPVGFINPVLYEHPEVFNDITNGTNPGCGTDGFSAVPGWDPVTGLGTPNYPKLLELFLSLP
ncbi:putative protease S8 tripeptidyl peptidase I [Truncatella angustata]|uniref:Protease S8 tripeptidyl peptidase I n=1 Tax=Truncatella angustata TaxID=152316 RepID=A0A9P8UNH6_9PEZI|nr:putative protease S8 tripeptidyl peptidase I [Truncatella angustata]KAH6655934.1 putative protease S8 tripeptidyl peptidase I [Truncatella angustata]